MLYEVITTTSTDVRLFSKTSKIARMKPWASSMRGERTRTSVTFRFTATAVTGRGGESAAILVPAPSGRRELSTHRNNFV